MTVGGWGSIPPGPCTSIETYDYIADKWEKTDLSLPSNRAYHGLEIIDRKVRKVTIDLNNLMKK